MALRPEAVARAFAQAIGAAWASTSLGATASVSPAPAPGANGWIVTVPATGMAAGLLTAWFEREGAIRCATRALGLETPAADDAVMPLLADLVRRAADSVEGSPEGAGLTLGDPVAQAGSVPEGVEPYVAAWADDTACGFAVAVALASASESASAAPASDSRLEAVLDVDLPLVVRFGRAIMPLRAVADLSPGSVVDMGRSPDEPVELLVGERLIARGEVVIVGGNYGVRITELTSGRRSAESEARS
jgi:flagellar motor switch protein FliN/FliY